MSHQKPGISRFEFHLASCETLLTKAAKQNNPGLWLYKNNFRTAIFMLEGLSKLYASIHNRKKFTKLRERFKFLEDALGAADYYDCFAKEFTGNKNIPRTAVNYLKDQFKQRIISLNGTLADKEWLTGKRIHKIKTALKNCDWEKPEKETGHLYDYYRDEIKKIIDFVNERKFHFENVEADVHELRRKLRWLSIYPQALRGCIQLTQNKKTAKYLEKYLTKEIVGSPFNKMPDAENNTYFLMLEQNHFYALSWMIAELGKIKDNGLRIFAVQEAVKQTEKLNDADALKRASTLLGKQQPAISQLLSQAESITTIFFKEKNLEALVNGKAAVKA
ncbi:MAG: hypothetical protein ABJA78_17560 [Ferruginibacter sp.]